MLYQKAASGLLVLTDRFFGARAEYDPAGNLLWSDGPEIYSWPDLLDDELLMNPDIWGGINDLPMYESGRSGRRYDHNNLPSVWRHENEEKLRPKGSISMDTEYAPIDFGKKDIDMGPAPHDVRRFGEFDDGPVSGEFKTQPSFGYGDGLDFEDSALMNASFEKRFSR